MSAQIINPHNLLFFFQLCLIASLPNRLLASILRTFSKHQSSCPWSALLCFPKGCRTLAEGAFEYEQEE